MNISIMVPHLLIANVMEKYFQSEMFKNRITVEDLQATDVGFVFVLATEDSATLKLNDGNGELNAVNDDTPIDCVFSPEKGETKKNARKR